MRPLIFSFSWLGFGFIYVRPKVRTTAPRLRLTRTVQLRIPSQANSESPFSYSLLLPAGDTFPSSESSISRQGEEYSPFDTRPIFQPNCVTMAYNKSYNPDALPA